MPTYYLSHRSFKILLRSNLPFHMETLLSQLIMLEALPSYLRLLRLSPSSFNDPFQPQTQPEPSMPQPEHNPPVTSPSGFCPLPIPSSMPSFEPSTAQDVWREEDKKLDAVVAFLEQNGGTVVLLGLELWIREREVTKKRFTPKMFWVDHGRRTVVPHECIKSDRDSSDRQRQEISYMYTSKHESKSNYQISDK